MITRRTLLKLVGLLPFVGPALAKALVQGHPADPPVFRPFLPATFPKWNPAVDGLEDAAAWALDIERARLPAGLALPREGQVWEAVRDCEILFCPLVWKLPMKLESAHIRAGDKVQIVHLDGTKPVFINFVRLGEGIPAAAAQAVPGVGPWDGALQLKTAKTVGDSIQREDDQLFFLEAFRLVTEAS